MWWSFSRKSRGRVVFREVVWAVRERRRRRDVAAVSTKALCDYGGSNWMK